MADGRPPRVSVAIYTCDQERLIGEAIESVVTQEHPDLEVVVADDHSRDATPEIVRDFARRYPTVVRPLLHTGCRSIVGNVNRGLAACTGELVATLDGDDLFLPGKLQAQVEAFARHPDAVICHHPVERFDDVTGRALRVDDGYAHEAPAAVRDLLRHGNFLATASCMMRRRALPPGGIPPVVDHVADWLLAILTARQGTIIRLPYVLARYRIHPNQITHVSSGDDRVFRDAMRTIAYVERRYPELASYCPQARRILTNWEAYRRLTGTADRAWINAGLRTALRHDVINPRLWAKLLLANARPRS